VSARRAANALAANGDVEIRTVRTPLDRPSVPGRYRRGYHVQHVRLVAGAAEADAAADAALEARRVQATEYLAEHGVPMPADTGPAATTAP
jgi:hypothetical protein